MDRVRLPLTTDPALSIVVEQINRILGQVESADQTTPVSLADDILNKALTVTVTGDYDLVYTDDGEIITDG